MMVQFFRTPSLSSQSRYYGRLQAGGISRGGERREERERSRRFPCRRLKRAIPSLCVVPGSANRSLPACCRRRAELAAGCASWGGAIWRSCAAATKRRTSAAASKQCTCNANSSSEKHCQFLALLYLLLYSFFLFFSGQRVCGLVNGRGFHIYVHVELAKLRNKNKKFMRRCGTILQCHTTGV